MRAGERERESKAKKHLWLLALLRTFDSHTARTDGQTDRRVEVNNFFVRARLSKLFWELSENERIYYYKLYEL